jgi:hypothetical protein
LLGRTGNAIVRRTSACARSGRDFAVHSIFAIVSCFSLSLALFPRSSSIQAEQPQVLVVDYIPSAMFIPSAYKARDISRITITLNPEVRFFREVQRNSANGADFSGSSIARLRLAIHDYSPAALTLDAKAGQGNSASVREAMPTAPSLWIKYRFLP